MALNREQILAQVQHPLEVERVKVPEWGGEVLIREWSGEERDRFEGSFVDPETGKRKPDAMENIRARIVALSVIDEKGEHQFSLDDVEALGRGSARALNRIFDKARLLHGLSDQDLKELEKN